jgi:hypothetical protein
MPWRWYPKINKVARADGTVARYKTRCKKWIKSGSKPYKPQKRGLERPSLYSTRFGWLDLYNRKQQQQLICPSGYSVSQCYNVLSKVWHGYHRARREKDIVKTEKYARAIQDVQKDMGIKTTSFPHLGIYGDVFILNNKNNERRLFEDHSALKKKQEEYEKWQAENSKEIQKHVQQPNKEEGEEIVTVADDIYPGKKVRPEEDEIVPDMLEADEDAGEELITMIDDIPLLNNYKNDKKTSLEYS